MLRRVVRRAAVRRSPRVAPGGPAAGAPVGRGRAAAYGRGMDVRRAEDRYLTSVDWLDSQHSFSFGSHYDPANTHHGLLLVNNDDMVAPGTGFETHPHRDMEIVTWVLDGSLVHQDSDGHSGVIYPGLAQRMSAGTGILHSREERLLAPGRRPRTTTPCTSCRCGSCPTRRASSPATSSARSTPSSLPGRWCRWRRACPSTATSRDPHREQGRRAARRPAAGRARR